MATHSSVLAWRIPGTGEPSGLPSMGSHSRTQLKWLSKLACIRKLVLVCFEYAETELIPVFRDGCLTQAWSKSFPCTKRQLHDIVKVNNILLWNWDSWESNLSLVLEECGGAALWGSLQENGSTAERGRPRSGEELCVEAPGPVCPVYARVFRYMINKSTLHSHTHTFFLHAGVWVKSCLFAAERVLSVGMKWGRPMGFNACSWSHCFSQVWRVKLDLHFLAQNFRYSSLLSLMFTSNHIIKVEAPNHSYKCIWQKPQVI